MAYAPGYGEMETCPYNKSHQILKERFQTHLIKCARSNPHIELEICPFNTSHRFKAEDKEKHITECESRGTMDRFLYVSSNRTDESQKKPKTPPQVKKRDNEDEESWDHCNVPTYRPDIYAQNSRVLRNVPLVTPSERRAFRAGERQRLSEIDRSRNSQP